MVKSHEGDGECIGDEGDNYIDTTDIEDDGDGGEGREPCDSSSGKSASLPPLSVC